MDGVLRVVPGESHEIDGHAVSTAKKWDERPNEKLA